jgi:hypothetical protein
MMNEIKYWICPAQDNINSPNGVRGFLLLIQATFQVYVWGEEQQLQAFSTSTLEESEWSASRSDHFTPEDNSTSTVQSSSPLFWQHSAKGSTTGDRFLDSLSDQQLDMIYIWYDISLNCNWVDTLWQQYSTHLHTNSTQNDKKNT